MSLSKTLNHLLIVLVPPRKTGKHLNMTENVLTGMSSINTNNHTTSFFLAGLRSDVRLLTIQQRSHRSVRQNKLVIVLKW